LKQIVTASRTLLFGTRSRLGLDFGVLFAWSAVNTALFSVCCIFTRWKGEGGRAGEAEAGVEKVTGIRQDSYLYRGNDNQILSKRLLDSYSSLTCFGVLRHSLLLDAYGEERRIE
jgi:hypothetical protein